MADPDLPGLSTRAMAAEMRGQFALAFAPCVRSARVQGVDSMAFAESALNALGQLMGAVAASCPIDRRNLVLAKIIEAMPEWMASAEEWERRA